MFRCAFFAAMLLLAVPSVHAQTTRAPPEGGGGARVAQQLQQLGQERTQLQAENARQKQELEKLKGELKAAQTERDTLKHKTGQTDSAVARANAQAQAAEASLQQSRKQIDDLVAKFRETVQSLRDVEADRAKKTQELKTLDASYRKCVTDNVALADMTDDVLTRYDKGGLGERIGRAEPFTRIARIRTENLVDEYRERAREFRAEQAAAPHGAAVAPK